MSLRISGKHMEIGDAFRARIESKVDEAVAKYFDGGYSGHVNVVKSGSRFTADCMVHLDSGMSLQATGEAQEPVASFEAAAERLEKRLRRYKRRLRSYGGNGKTETFSYSVVAALAADEDEIDEDYAPTIVAETALAVKTMSVASAVVELDTKDSPVFVFRNVGSQQINIVYRRPDGNIGWIDPSARAT